ncbi:MAG: TFIIB-type zinc ribbon-containing protein [Firmicutes bacterium]|uniref:TFIIB-type zinc ribbon-containing protein n=1 Tax=Candidatus Onthovivens merdipullorum TaxID=2840889 RepID=A0A9D9DGI8_9BACL|nr:TFIIB-type zinc ribbon-containing protein [Candidatus Onthovivens merdipullorum]
MIKEDYLENITLKIKSYVNKHNDFSDLYNLLLTSKIKLNYKYNYNEALIKASEIKLVLDKIISIIYKPHIKSITNEVILRSELVNNVSVDSFRKTTKDIKLWKLKDNNKLTPEYVYSLENIDTIDTYENRFISLLVDTLDKVNKEILLNLNPLMTSIEETYERSGLSYGVNSIMSDLVNNHLYPYSDLLTKVKTSKASVYKVVKSISTKIKHIKGSEFYKLTSKKLTYKNILPTNILLHDPLYNYCYKYYKENYLNEDLDNLNKDTYYYNYVLISLIKHLALLNIGKTSISKSSKVYIDNNKRLRFNKIAFKKGLFSFILNEDPSNLGFYIETKLTNRAIRVDTKVNNTYKNLNYVLTSLNFYKDNEDRLIKTLKNSYAINNNLFTMNNLIGNYDNVINLSIYKEDSETILNNYLSSLVMLFNCDLDLIKTKCPVCGRNEISFDGYNYRCLNCGSYFSINDTSKGSLMRLKSLRRI